VRVAEQAVIVDEEEARGALRRPSLRKLDRGSHPANLESRAAARHLLSSLNCRLSTWLSILGRDAPGCWSTAWRSTPFSRS